MAHTLEIEKVESLTQENLMGASEADLIELIAQHSTAVEIGCDLLQIETTDGTLAICKKMNSACRNYPDHLAEIMLAGLMAVVFKSDTKQETVDGFMFAIGLADRVLAH